MNTQKDINIAFFLISKELQMASVNKKLSDYIRENNISQSEVAKKTGIAQSNLNRLLNSDDLRISHLIQITKALGLPPSYFFDGKEHISNEEIEGYKKRIDELEYLVNLNRRAEIEKYIQVTNEILKYEFQHESQELKNKVLGDFVDSIKVFDEIFNELALEVSQFSRETIKKNIHERIERIKREEKLAPRAKNIQKIRGDKEKSPIPQQIDNSDITKELREAIKKDDQKKAKKKT